MKTPAALDDTGLDEAVRRTLDHYDRHADAFWLGTRDHDVSQNVAALARHIQVPAPWTVLDLGCGPGRDLQTFTDMGHHAIGLEGAARLAEMARLHSGCEVWHQDFLAMTLPEARFDGVFANASLFHVPARALPGVLHQLRATLKPGGVLFSSNPRGDDVEGWSANRHGTYWSLAGWRAQVEAAGFIELEHYYRPEGLPRERQPWLASLWRTS